MLYRNAADAFVAKLGEIVVNGEDYEVRGHMTRELCHQTVTLEQPLERCIVVPGRRNDVFASIAETVWVLAGRNDLQFLAPYLPRSSDFSDDGGITWRAGYGPRLRTWDRSVDQIGEVLRLLSASESSRRAVITLFDPNQDFQDSNDVPCTNWLHFTVRAGAVDLAVTVRSNDLMWGFSGINTFEWSVLQEMVAFWLGKKVGKVTYFISSLHLYERHFERASRILSSPVEPGIYNRPLRFSRFATPFNYLSDSLAQWFDLEERIRTGTSTRESLSDVEDPLLRDFLAMLRAYWAFHSGRTSEATELLGAVQDQALRAAGASYFAWKSAPLDPNKAMQPELRVDPLSDSELREYILRRRYVRNLSQATSRSMDAVTPPPEVLLTHAAVRLHQVDPQAHAQRFEAAVDLFMLTLQIQESLLDLRDGKQAADNLASAVEEFTATTDAPDLANLGWLLESILSMLPPPGESGALFDKRTAMKILTRRSFALARNLAHAYPVQVRQAARDLSSGPSEIQPSQ